MLFVTVCCPNGTYGMDCKECAGGRAHPCNGNGQCMVSMSSSYLMTIFACILVWSKQVNMCILLALVERMCTCSD